MARTQTAAKPEQSFGWKELRPYVILGGLTLALVAEVWVISAFWGGTGGGSARAIHLPSFGGNSAQYHSNSTDDMRTEDQSRASDQASIQGNVLNPVESVFSTQEQQKRAEQFGLK